MAGDEERLLVLVEARIRDFEKNMAKASGTAGRTYDGMRRSSRSATRQMEADMIRSTGRINQALAMTAAKIGTFGKAFVGGLVGGIAAGGVAGILSSVRDVARGVAEIGDQARRAGLSFQSFQELSYLAQKNRIEVDALVDGIKELNLRADEFVATGGGSAAEAFGRLGYSAEALKNKMKDPAELFTEIIGKLQQLDRAARIRIADELFGGTGGEKFVQLIEQGADGIRDARREAHNLGAVMSDEVIQKAEELDQKFNQITASVGTGLKTAIVEAAGAMQKFIELYQGWQSDYDKRRNISEAGATIGGMVGTLPDPNAARTTPKTSRLPAEVPALPTQADLAAKYLANYRAELALTNRERAIAAEAEKILSDSAAKGLAITKEQAQALAQEKVARDESEASAKKLGSAREQAASKSETERQAVRDLIVELQEELRLIGATDAERRASEASRMAGAAATEEERQQIIALNEAIYQEAAALDTQQQVLDLYRDTTRGAIDDLISGAEQGKSLWDNLADTAVNALRRISSALIDDVLNSMFQVNNAASGGSLFGNLFAGIFGGGTSDPWAGLRLPSFDGGGSTGSGSRTGGMDGRGGFPAIVHPQETIVDHTRGQSAGGQNVHVTSDVRVSVDDSGNLRAFVERTSATQSRSALRSYDRALPDRLQQINRNPTKRHSSL